ncbi:hypothetical protein A4A58_19660 [Tardiphaga robiniae]|uniref:Uncharacterized protein n=1 Tax=Tardiphaga robiniae TaxID=943830 RepID=A0A161SKF2_9BRAD|nr:hypothetical protein A4A58_19660 [Tardiphaga robiniae]
MHFISQAHQLIMQPGIHCAFGRICCEIPHQTRLCSIYPQFFDRSQKIFHETRRSLLMKAGALQAVSSPIYATDVR